MEDEEKEIQIFQQQQRRYHRLKSTSVNTDCVDRNCCACFTSLCRGLIPALLCSRNWGHPAANILIPATMEDFFVPSCTLQSTSYKPGSLSSPACPSHMLPPSRVAAWGSADLPSAASLCESVAMAIKSK